MLDALAMAQTSPEAFPSTENPLIARRYQDSPRLEGFKMKLNTLGHLISVKDVSIEDLKEELSSYVQIFAENIKKADNLEMGLVKVSIESLSFQGRARLLSTITASLFSDAEKSQMKGIVLEAMKVRK
jgi:hypothetical protein